MTTSAVGRFSVGCIADGDAAAVVLDRDRAVEVDRDVDAIAEARQRLVDGVVDDLVDHVVQARAVIGVADVHARALAHRLEALEDLDALLVVRVGPGLPLAVTVSRSCVSPGGLPLRGGRFGWSSFFDRSDRTGKGPIVQRVQVSPPTTNLNSFNYLTSFTRAVKAACHGFATTLPARTRKSPRSGSGGTMSRSVTEIRVWQSSRPTMSNRNARRVGIQLARNVVEQQHGRVAQARLDVRQLGQLERQHQRAQLALRRVAARQARPRGRSRGRRCADRTR